MHSDQAVRCRQLGAGQKVHSMFWFRNQFENMDQNNSGMVGDREQQSAVVYSHDLTVSKYFLNWINFSLTPSLKAVEIIISTEK